jgi:hypothetical protein
MLEFLRRTFSFDTNSYRRLSSGSMYAHPTSHRNFTNGVYRVPKDGIHVQVGKPPSAQIIHISAAALRESSVLQQQLSQGVRIVNVDPVIFKVALQYIERSGFFAWLRPFAKNPFDQLLGGSDEIVDLVKAWHLAYMLDLPRMQNRVMDTLITCYKQSLKSGIRRSLCYDPWHHLRKFIGNHQKCERFLFDFYAGLSVYGEDFRPEELEQLPPDIANKLQTRRACMAVDKRLVDRVKKRHADYTVPVTPGGIMRCRMHVFPPRGPLGTSNGAPPSPSSPEPPARGYPFSRSRSMPPRRVRPPFFVVESPLQQRRRARIRVDSESSDESERYVYLDEV